MKIGITGGIGCGKSFVCQRLASQGVRIYNCDNAAKQLMVTSDKVRQNLVSLIGQDAYIDGKPNKPLLTQFLLASKANAQRLNNILHPAVAQDFISSGMQWMECAIIFESGFDRLVNYIVAVSAPEQVRIQRVMQRDGVSEGKVRQWMSQQMNQEELCKRADFVIVNDGVRSIDTQIEELMAKIKYLSH